MRIYILDPDGNAIDHSNEALPSRWREAIVQTVKDVNPEGIERDPEDLAAFVSEQQDHNQHAMEDRQIVHAYMGWANGQLTVEEDGKPVDALDYIKRACVAGWLFDYKIISDFDRKADTSNGYAKIMPSGIEYGWLDHDGLHRLVM